MNMEIFLLCLGRIERDSPLQVVVPLWMFSKRKFACSSAIRLDPYAGLPHPAHTFFIGPWPLLGTAIAENEQRTRST